MVLGQSPSYRFLDAMPAAPTLGSTSACPDWASEAKLAEPVNEGFAVPTQVGRQASTPTDSRQGDRQWS